MSGPPTYLEMLQNNDMVVTLNITDPSVTVNNIPQPLDLTGSTVRFVRKATEYTPDTDPSAVTYEGTIDSPATAGKVEFAIPDTDNATPGITWWRVDVTKTGSTRTVNYGPLEVKAV
jgi:hypothetical protein